MFKLLLLPILLSACMPKVFPEDEDLPVPAVRSSGGELSVDFNVAWEVVVEVLAEAAPIADTNESTGLVETGFVFGPSNDVFTAYGGTRIPESARYRYYASVEPTASGSFVTVYGQQWIEKDMISVDREFTGAVYQWIEVSAPVQKIQELWSEIQETSQNRTGTSQEYDYRY
jgi:hypothetical protein